MNGTIVVKDMNKNAKEFEDVKVYVSGPIAQPFKGRVRGLTITGARKKGTYFALSSRASTNYMAR